MEGSQVVHNTSTAIKNCFQEHKICKKLLKRKEVEFQHKMRSNLEFVVFELTKFHSKASEEQGWDTSLKPKFHQTNGNFILQTLLQSCLTSAHTCK